MKTAVVDANVLVSGFGWSSGPPRQVVQAALDARFILITTADLLAEFRRVIEYPRLATQFPDPDGLVALVQEVAVERTPNSRVKRARDPDDDRVLEAAMTGGVDAVVTGDKDLLVLGSHVGIPILTPADFMAFLGT